MRSVRFLLGMLLALLVCASFSRAGELLVGAYYYPWYGPFAGGHEVRQSVRGHLVPPQLPAVGLYSSRDPAVIARHIDHSRQANIAFWAVSWWGPEAADDRTFRESILKHPRAAELKYAVHYESTGRLGRPERPNFEQLLADFRHLAQHYFADPNYLRFGDRPVVFLYVTRVYFHGPAAREAVAQLRATMRQEFAFDPYLVGDDLFTEGVQVERARLWDAVTDFDVYGTAFQQKGSTAQAIDDLAGFYDRAQAALAPLGVAFIPTASPGFNDKGVRGGHPAAARYLVDQPDSRPGDVFARVLKIASQRVDPQAHHVLMINSFNEWHEDTQIEPTVEAPHISADDSGRDRYSEGLFYEGYGDKYLQILRAAVAPPPVSSP